MENSYGTPKSIIIDISSVFWNLLMQWKALLLVCILVSLLVMGVKYCSDRGAYESELANQKASAEQSSKPADEQIENALSSLSPDQRDAVLFLVQQQDMIDTQKDYLNNSILLNIDPARQRQLSTHFLLKSDSATSMRTLVDSYNTFIHGEAFLSSLREIISPETDIEYIDELIATEHKADEVVIYDDSNSVIYTVTIILPASVESDAVTDLVSSSISGYHDDLDSLVGEHSLKMISSEDRTIFNEDINTRRNALISSVNSLLTGIENSKGKLSEQQISAFESIISIKHAEDNIQDKETTGKSSSNTALQAPGLNKMYALLGFVLGAILYASSYVIILAIRKAVTSAQAAQSYTRVRLLGELYRLSEHKGLSWLFSSAKVARLKYGVKLDEARQINALTSTMEAVCKHHNIDNIVLLRSGMDAGFDSQISRITESIGNNREVFVLDADSIDENDLASVTNAAYVVCNRSNSDNLIQLMNLIRDYEIQPIGTIYMEAL